MKRATLLAMAAVMAVGVSVPAQAAYVRLGSVEVGYRTDADTAYTRFGGGMESLRLTADRSDIFCRSIRVRYANGDVDNVFRGALREDRPVNVDLRGHRAHVDSIRFVCRSDEFRGGKIYIAAEVGRYGDEWRRHRDWDRLWSGIFGMGHGPGPFHDEWITLGRESFEGRHDSESTFAGWRGHSVDRIGLRPLNADARCTRVMATFENGRTRDLYVDRFDRMERDRVTVIDLPGRDRNLRSLYLQCRAVGERRVIIEILARR